LRAVAELRWIADARRGSTLGPEEERVGRTLRARAAAVLLVIARADGGTADEHPALAAEEHVVRTLPVRAVARLGDVARTSGSTAEGADGRDDVVGTGTARAVADLLWIARAAGRTADRAGADQMAVRVAARVGVAVAGTLVAGLADRRVGHPVAAVV